MADALNDLVWDCIEHTAAEFDDALVIVLTLGSLSEDMKSGCDEDGTNEDTQRLGWKDWTGVAGSLEIMLNGL